MFITLISSLTVVPQVVQSAFADPCRKLENGFASGFQPVAADATQFPEFSITINDTNPIWAYVGIHPSLTQHHLTSRS